MGASLSLVKLGRLPAWYSTSGTTWYAHHTGRRREGDQPTTNSPLSSTVMSAGWMEPTRFGAPAKSVFPEGASVSYS